MNQNNMTYRLYEGEFLTLAPDLDQTVNILMFRDPEEKEYSVLINRAFLEQDQSLMQFCESEIGKMRNTLSAFQEEGKRLQHQIGPFRLPVIQVANRYLHQGKMTRQVQSIIQLPRHEISNPLNNRIIIFTLSTVNDFTEHQRRHYVKIINSFTPDTTPLNIKS
ncbi:DcrB-related protein [[Erwinia] mediterraneensis]|uniref:DcrB-related protein n=1 Tax=[Erwinia] mediterraneensis TaxID=2161819 RepID=UPI00102FACFC|nr:DcrB-related protein [[Erwinia] mediterraneensis]